jgi:hypothetical protein
MINALGKTFVLTVLFGLTPGCQFDEGGYDPSDSGGAVLDAAIDGIVIVDELGTPDGLIVDGPSSDIFPDQSADTLSTDSSLDATSPDANVDSISPDTSLDSVAPDTSVDSVSPDTSVDSVSPDTSVDSVSPDATVDTVAPCLLTDLDGDTKMDGCDNCKFVYNPSQTDMDGDDIGDACDPDLDGDTIGNENNDTDLDGDGLLNSTDTDDDNDGMPDTQDPNSMVFQEPRFYKGASSPSFAADMDTDPSATWGKTADAYICSEHTVPLEFALLKSTTVPATFTDYTVEATFSLEFGNLGSSAGLFVRAEDTASGQSGYLCMIKRSNTGLKPWNLILTAHEDGSKVGSKELFSPAFELSEAPPIRLRVTASGNSLKCEMVSPTPNGQAEELNANWTNFPSGSVGFWSTSVKACFTYFTVVDAL